MKLRRLGRSRYRIECHKQTVNWCNVGICGISILHKSSNIVIHAKYKSWGLARKGSVNVLSFCWHAQLCRSDSRSSGSLVMVSPGKKKIKKKSYRASLSKVVPCKDIYTFLKGREWLPSQLGKIRTFTLHSVKCLYKWQSTEKSDTNPFIISALVLFLSFSVVPILVMRLAYKQNIWYLARGDFFTVLKEHIKKGHGDNSLEQVLTPLSLRAGSICAFKDNLFPVRWNNRCSGVSVQINTRGQCKQMSNKTEVPLNFISILLVSPSGYQPAISKQATVTYPDWSCN